MLQAIGNSCGSARQSRAVLKNIYVINGRLHKHGKFLKACKNIPSLYNYLSFMPIRPKCTLTSHVYKMSSPSVMGQKWHKSRKVLQVEKCLFKGASEHHTTPMCLTKVAQNEVSTEEDRLEARQQAKKKRVKRKRSPSRKSADTKFPESKSINIDNHITVFLKRKKMYDIKLKHEKEFSLFLPRRDELINVALKDTSLIEAIKKDLERMEAENGDPKLNSIDELMWQEIKLDVSKLPVYYMQLSKIRLTALVVTTELAGYFLAPGVFDPMTLLCATVGTGLASCSANAINQYLEIPYDSQMNRTKNRVLVRGILSPLHAVGFAAVAGGIGIMTLALGANTLTATLGIVNIGLYTMVYTPMKRLNMANTWVGSVVGAIPPLMGWTACTGVLDPGALLLGGIMFAWQFPHFNSLSWNLRQDYSRAGYRMMSVVNPALCKRVAFRYTLGMIGLCTLAPVMDLTTWAFAVDSLPLNLYFAYLGWRFYRDGDSKSSRKLFKFSLIHIPFLFILMFISKKSYKDRLRPKQTEENVSA